jgi:hypothetical protein
MNFCLGLLFDLCSWLVLQIINIQIIISQTAKIKNKLMLEY